MLGGRVQGRGVASLRWRAPARQAYTTERRLDRAATGREARRNDGNGGPMGGAPAARGGWPVRCPALPGPLGLGPLSLGAAPAPAPGRGSAQENWQLVPYWRGARQSLKSFSSESCNYVLPNEMTCM